MHYQETNHKSIGWRQAIGEAANSFTFVEFHTKQKRTFQRLKTLRKLGTSEAMAEIYQLLFFAKLYQVMNRLGWNSMTVPHTEKPFCSN